MIGENAPKPDWWNVDPHTDPFAVTEPVPSIPRNIHLGEN